MLILLNFLSVVNKDWTLAGLLNLIVNAPTVYISIHSVF